jgi:hypothetical protein
MVLSVELERCLFVSCSVLLSLNTVAQHLVFFCLLLGYGVWVEDVCVGPIGSLHRANMLLNGPSLVAIRCYMSVSLWYV